MKAQELRAFIAVCKYNSFSMAAEKLFMTQPTISWLIQSLEKEWGKTLFTRGKGVRQVSLTQAGQKFYSQAERFLQLWEETEAMLSDQQRDLFHFACTPSVSSLLLPPINRYFKKTSPQCQLYLEIDKSPNLFHAVEQGSVDCALLCQIQPTSRINILPFASERQVFVCRKDAKYKDSVSVDELDIHDEVFLHVDDSGKAWQRKHFGTKGTPPITIEMSFSISDYFLGKDSWSVMPISRLTLMGDEYRICELDDLPNNRMFYLVSKTSVNKIYYANLIHVIRQEFQKIDGIKLLVDNKSTPPQIPPN